MKKLLFVMLVALAAAGCTQKKGEIVLYNDTIIHRVGEMVEVDAAMFPTEEGEWLVIRDAENEKVPYQITYDGKLIFQADVKAGEEVRYSVATTPVAPKFQTYACGRVYPERVDDVAWESDLIAYRAYGPALQKSGERAFGYDVWVKNNTDLPVVEARYAKELNPETKARIAELRESGDAAAADALAASVSYHNDHGNGFDAYKVGPTLGGGATALLGEYKLWRGEEKIYYPYCWAECEILDNGPLRFTARLTYNPTEVDGEVFTEVRTISLDKGSFLNKTTVVYNGAEGSVLPRVMAGIVLHEESPRALVNEELHYVTYAEPVEAPDGGELYQAMYFPEGWLYAQKRFWRRGDEEPAGAFGHLVAYLKPAVGEPVTYYWGALWSHSTLLNVKSKEKFDNIMSKVVDSKCKPLDVNVIMCEK